MRLFTHTDLDGVGCAILMRSLFKEEEHIVDVSYCDYNNVDEKIQNFVNEKTDKKMDDYDYIFITDISVNEETAALLNDVEEGDVTPFVQLLDHHNTAKWLNKYDWAYVNDVYEDGHKTSGTSLIIDFFNERSGFERETTPAIKHFAETVRKYDTWEWTTHYNEVLPKELNDYLYMIGRPAFVEYVLNEVIVSGDEPIYFNEKARALLDQKQAEIKSYIQKKGKQIRISEVQDSKVGIVFAEQYVSELGNELAKQNLDLEFIILIDMGEKKVSYRTVREDIDLGKVAKKYGGGGHPKAAGSQFSEEFVLDFLNELF